MTHREATCRKKQQQDVVNKVSKQTRNKEYVFKMLMDLTNTKHGMWIQL